jgi:hypothetical protein
MMFEELNEIKSIVSEKFLMFYSNCLSWIQIICRSVNSFVDKLEDTHLSHVLVNLLSHSPESLMKNVIVTESPLHFSLTQSQSTTNIPRSIPAE